MPVLSSTTQRLYARLPEFYRVADIGTDYTFAKWLEGIGSQLGDLEDLIDGFYDDQTLVNPQTAPYEWLEWMAQLVGVTLDRNLSEAEQRDSIQYASSGWRAGTKTAIADAAKTALTGSKHVEVYDHSVTVPGDGGQWDVLLVTRSSETPDVPAVLATVVAKGAKPAGVVLHHRAYDPTWATVHTQLPAWSNWNGKTWAEVQEVGL